MSKDEKRRFEYRFVGGCSRTCTFDAKDKEEAKKIVQPYLDARGENFSPNRLKEFTELELKVQGLLLN